MRLARAAAVSSLLVATALAVQCRPPTSSTSMGAASLPEGFGTRTAPSALPEISAEAWARSPAVQRCETGVCRVGTTFEDERAPAKMSSWLLEPGTSLRVDPDPSVDVFAMVLTGHAYATKPVTYQREQRELDEGPTVGAWTAVRSIGDGLMIYNSPNDPPVALVLVIARDAPAAMHQSEAANTTDGGASDASAASDGGARSKEPKCVIEAPVLRRSPLAVRRLADIEWLSWGAGAFRAKLVFDGPDSQRASLSVLVGGATANVAEHTHDHSYELLTAVVADGMVNVWGTGEGSLGHQSVVRPGDPQVIPMGVRHAWVGAGTVPLIAVQAYAPSGPEQRFRELSRH
ncbi:MAG: hypothetical protein U0269_17925 [Polyangiales bacterium]